MEKFGIPSKLVKMVRTCIEESRCKIKFGNNYSEEFETTVGLKQGDVLSPIVFNVTLEEVVRKVQETAKGVSFNGQMHALLAYADDVVILGLNEEDIKTTTEDLITSAMNMGLMINEGKTKYMIVKRGNQLHQNRSLNIGNYCFEKVESFKYLGVDINSHNNYHEEINLRVKAGNRCYFALQKTFRSKLLSKKSKMRLYKVLVRPVILYACETWPTSKEDERKLAVLERKFLRRIFGPKKNDQTGEYEIRSNKEIKNLLGEEDIIQTLKGRKMSWLGHVWRSNGIMKDALKWKPEGKRPLGRPKKRWIDKPNQFFRILGVDNPEKLANDREEWRRLCGAVMGLNGLQ